MQSLCTEIARRLAALGYTLRSGGAVGADTAFERGAPASQLELYLPNPGHNGRRSAALDRPTAAAHELAARFHPAWDRCAPYVRELHARNGHIVLGADLDDPVRFIICWTPRGSGQGGTGQALRLATAASIPVFDLGLDAVETRLRRWLERKDASLTSPLTA